MSPKSAIVAAPVVVPASAVRVLVAGRSPGSFTTRGMLPLIRFTRRPTSDGARHGIAAPCGRSTWHLVGLRQATVRFATEAEERAAAETALQTDGLGAGGPRGGVLGVPRIVPGLMKLPARQADLA